MQNNAFDEDIKNLEEALVETPGNATLRRQLGDLLVKAEEFQRAEEELKRALQYKPDDVRIHFSLAKLYAKQGKNGAALVILEELLKKQDVPSDVNALYSALTNEEKETHEDQSPQFDEPEKVKLAIDVKDDESEAEVEEPQIDFLSVGGMDRVKEEIRMKIILPMTNVDLYKAYGKKAGGGILLYGPPGCGKTHLARATAGEIKAKFISIGLNDILDMYLGQSEQKLHTLFEQARANKPCVLFFDEVDALGANRGDLRKQAGRTIVNQFLMELDGLSTDNEDILILAATNAPWYLDHAFRRPGRFDRIIFVEPPDLKAREDILTILLKDKPVEKLNLEKVAKKVEHFSGADLKALIDCAIESKLKEAMKAGKMIPLSTNDLLTAAKTLQSSTREWFTTAKNYAVYANESGLYDAILDYLRISK